MASATSDPFADPLRHHEDVVDAASHGGVNSSTELAVMARLGSRPAEMRYLKSLTGIADCAVLCRIRLEDGSTFPATLDARECGYRLYLTYNKIMISPRVRLECRFVDRASPLLRASDTISLEFHFSSTDSRKLEGFSISSQDQISFTSHGATSEGFGRLNQYEHGFREHERAIVGVLSSLRSPTSARLDILPVQQLSGGAAALQRSIIARLPGGDGELFESFQKSEYHAFGPGATVDGIRPNPTNERQLGAPRRPQQLMSDGFPMIALDAAISFSSVKEAMVYLVSSTSTAFLEERQSLQLWAEVPHNTTIFRLDHCELPILAVKFNGRFRRLGTASERKYYRLPRDLHTNAKKTPFTHSNVDVRRRALVGELTLECRLSDVSGLPGYDALFEVLNCGFDLLRAKSFAIADRGTEYPATQRLYFDPHCRSFTFKSLLTTAHLLQHPSCPWQPVLLNEDWRCLTETDITGHIDMAYVRAADEWLLNCIAWNAEQRRVLTAVHATTGGIVVVKGIAGTGKTLLLSILSIYFARLGFKVLIAPPSNSNADHSAKEVVISDHRQPKLLRWNQRETEDCRTPNSDLPTPVRIFAVSSGSANGSIGPEQAQYAQPFHEDGSSSSLRALLHVLKGSMVNETRRICGIERMVIDAAQNGEFKRVLWSRNPTNAACPLEMRRYDTWDEMRKLIQAARTSNFDLDTLPEGHEAWYKTVYGRCKSHVLAVTDILITTTGNARCSEVLEDWLNPDKAIRVPCKGVVVLCDEAFKDAELCTWNAICAPGSRVKGVFMFGDDRQLKPVNTASRHEMEYGQCNAQGDLALTTRLGAGGFPDHLLMEQSRMHPELSDFVSREFYLGRLRNSGRCQGVLQRAFQIVLHRTIAKSFSTESARQDYIETATDKQARHHYIEVCGERKPRPENGTSVCVDEHVEVFFQHILPALQEYFGDETSKNVMVICAYSAALRLYKENIEHLRQTQVLPASLERSQQAAATPEGAGAIAASSASASRHGPARPTPRHSDTLYPRCLTVDASQGQESYMVIFDGSFQHSDRIGFMDDRGRSNVAMTRAREVFWIIGGPLTAIRTSSNVPSPFPKLKREMERQGKVHKLQPLRPEEGSTEQAPGREALGHSSVARALLC